MVFINYYVNYVSTHHSSLLPCENLPTNTVPEGALVTVMLSQQPLGLWLTLFHLLVLTPDLLQPSYPPFYQWNATCSDAAHRTTPSSPPI